MANKKVTLVIRVKTEKGWSRYPAVIGTNSRVRPGYGLVKGVPVEFKAYSYEARYYKGSKLAYKPVGNQATLALAEANKMGKVMVARNTAIEAGVAVVEESGREKLATLLDVFVKAAESRGAMEQAHHYRITNEEFLAATERVYADQVTTNDFMKYQGLLRKQGYSDRTIFNRHVRVKSFLTFAGVEKGVFPSRAPRYEKSLPHVYTEEELKSFFAFLSGGKLKQHQEMREQYLVTFRLAHQCGLRERELMHVQWPDLKFSTRILQVRSKPEWGFFIKDKEERDLPMPLALVELLKSFKETNGSRKFITGTRGDKPNSHLLRTLKRVVNAAGLNCGECGTCLEQEECEKWFLHKFRASYATNLLRGGLDIRSVQKLMGHSDLESTMRYLRPAEDAELQSKVNAMTW